MAEFGEHLHGICQPLTALQCRLEICEMNRQPDEIHTAIAEALRECHRLSERVRAMQTAWRDAMTETQSKGKQGQG